MGVQHSCPDLLLVWLKDRCIFIGDQSEFNCEGSCLAYETTVPPLHRGPNVGKLLYTIACYHEFRSMLNSFCDPRQSLWNLTVAVSFTDKTFTRAMLTR